MTLEQLRIFVAVAEREHVTRAAHDLRLTQSAVSSAVSTLEGRYATKLFDRIGRRIALTDAGRVFLGEARAVLARAAAAEAVLGDLAGLKKGRLALAASQTVASYWLPAVIHAFQERFPGVAVTLDIANTEIVAEAVMDGAADLGVVEGAVDEPALEATPVAEDEIVLVVGPGHPWADGRTLTGVDLVKARWVLREPGSGTRAVLEAAIAEVGVGVGALDVAIEFPSNEAVRAAVEAEAGAAVMSRMVAAASLASGKMTEAAFALPNRRFFALRRRDRYVTKASTAFLEMMAEIGEAPSKPASAPSL
ncbi:LysR family transcriptional regulator [Chenggangzhangella methanolivorans]|uniref:LysR family transcriptional regulator n=1 Tax=Chenggangzhangella methanolivorans TaxID=1437009 RepID=A0A9E6UNF1_9HYPH|nr:LysR family transcriptional regulator [Chenggangzhangella methanolivorans]QZO01021.1 LysR family transcriptional regulator [Chenggangzhangella methanolivorans]